ncbi:MAG: hydrogenase iron-sulfur subunit [Deltaproteobacteria bacterium]|nr:hydrogenase iron-sulfur subunit [Deltaproteobacteria bacterium]MBW2143115.1 hydrogenase iron-sulfur subunit [Deltaproteobacteria bacterium]
MTTDLKIILFMCNWGPHAAYQTLQDTGAQIPAEIKMVRIPCAGRISKALLLRPFEMGADGVAMVGCKPGACRYGTGTDTSLNNVEEAQGILDLLGLRQDRLRLGNFMPDESESLLRFLTDFCDVIKTIGKSPVTPAPKTAPITDGRDIIKQIVIAHDIYACQDCGKCSSACPLTLSGKPFSPRAIANTVIAGDIHSDLVQKDIWACLTCGLCYDRCPSAVNFPNFIQDMRHLLRKMKLQEIRAHGGFFQSLMRTMTTKDLEIRHWEWLPKDIKLDPESDVLFFGGCAPYFDIFFRRHLKVQTMDILVDSLRLLNFFDIYPAVLQGERCCGHDLLWSGDKENFLKLAELNVEAIHQAGIKRVVTACPECYRTLAHDYPKQGIEIDFEVTHIFDLLEKEIDKGAVGFKKLNKTITFQDPCRLSRFEDRADLPRKLIRRIAPDSFNEMEDKGVSAICCGNCAWTSCDSFSKALQMRRIRQARDTKSDVLVTACPKCQIHFSCAMEDPFFGEELSMEMMDLTSVLAKTIQWE